MSLFNAYNNSVTSPEKLPEDPYCCVTCGRKEQCCVKRPTGQYFCILCCKCKKHKSRSRSRSRSRCRSKSRSRSRSKSPCNKCPSWW